MLKTFTDAASGILEFFMKERNARIHFSAASLVVVMGFLFHISSIEWMFLVVMIMAVMVTEMVNTSIESLCDHLHPGLHEKIRIVKDLAAGAVFLTAFASLVVGAIIFIPRILP